MKRIVEIQLRRILSLFLVLSMCVGQSYAAEATATTVQLMKTEGTAGVTNSGGRALTVRKNMRLYNGYHVNTEAESYAWVNLDNDKLTKLDESSEMELRKENRKLEVLLNEGNLYFNVEKPLEDSESMNIRTSTMVVGIRGTCGWVRVVDRWTTEVSVLEGVVQCTVTDPVSGQSKTTTVKGGEQAVFVVYDPTRAGDKCDILREDFTEGDIPGFVLVELVRDTQLCEKIYADSGIDLLPITPEEAENRLKSDQAEQAERLEEREHLVSEQERHVSVEPVWKNNTPASPGSSSGGGGTSSGPSGVIRLTMPVTAREVQNYLDIPAVTGVILLPGSGNNTFSVDIAMTVPGGKSLTLNTGVPARVEAGNSMTVNGTAGLNDALTNLGTVTVNSANTLRVGGNLTNNSTMIVPATGRSITEGAFTNNQTLTLTAGARVLARTFNLAAPVAGWTVTGPQSDGYYRLVQAQPAHTITFNNDGSTGTTGEDGTLTTPLPDLGDDADGNPFDGWYTQPDGGGEKVTTDTIFTEDTTLYPHWTQLYTVTFDAAGGTVTPASAKTGTDGKLASLPTPTRTDYVFGGWFTTDGTQVTTSTVFTQDTTISARWGGTPAPTTYSIKLDYNVADVEGRVVSTKTDGKLDAENLSAPPIEGRDFLGWFTARADGEGEAVTTDYVFTSDAIIYAHWKALAESYTITFDENPPNGSESPTSTANTDESGMVPSDDWPTPASYTGYTFGGWFNAVDGDTQVTADTVFTADTTVYAHWTKNVDATISGTVNMPETEDSAASPVSGASVQLFKDGGDTARAARAANRTVVASTTTAAGGTYSLPISVAPGEYTLAADTPGYTGEQSIIISEDTTSYTQNLTLGDAWEYDADTKTLTIKGNGPMANYDTSYDAANQPWYSSRTEIEKIVLNDGVTSIGQGAFQYCSNLANITIPDSVTSIGSHAFRNCSALTDIAIPANVTSIGQYAFFQSSNLKNISIPNSVISIGEGAFSYTGPTSITLPSGITSIANQLFQGCNQLADIEIPESVTSIGQYAFNGCSGLTSVTIPDGVTSIGGSTFSGCSNLISIIIPDGVTSIGGSTFSGCTSLTSITIPGSVTSIGNYAFSTCGSLTSITIPGRVTSIGEFAFQGCVKLTSITIPNGVTSIEKGTFYGCSRLTSVTIPDSVTSIGDSAFSVCEGLTDVYYTSTEEQWNTITIGSTNDKLTSAKKHYNSTSA